MPAALAHGFNRRFISSPLGKANTRSSGNLSPRSGIHFKASERPPRAFSCRQITVVRVRFTGRTAPPAFTPYGRVRFPLPPQTLRHRADPPDPRPLPADRTRMASLRPPPGAVTAVRGDPSSTSGTAPPSGTALSRTRSTPPFPRKICGFRQNVLSL